MGEAVLAAVTGFQNILLAQKNDLNTTELEAQSLNAFWHSPWQVTPSQTLYGDSRLCGPCCWRLVTISSFTDTETFRC